MNLFEVLNPYTLEYTAIDFETTGLDPAFQAIVEVGAVKIREGREIASFQTLVNPGIPIPPGVTEIHGITDAMVENAPAVGSVLPDLLSFLRGTIVVAHNAPFDVGFLEAAIAAERRKGKQAALLEAVVDTRVLAKSLVKGEAGYSLQHLASKFQIPVIQAHRALDDARVCSRLLLILFEKLKAFPLKEANSILFPGISERRLEYLKISESTAQLELF